MIKNKEKKTKIQNNLFFFLITGIVIISVFTTTVGFALYNRTLSLSGRVSMQAHGQVEIIRASINSKTNVISATNPEYNVRNVSFNVVFGNQDEGDEYKIVYQFDIANNSGRDFTFTALEFNTDMNVSTGDASANIKYELVGIDSGDILVVGETRTFNLVVSLENVTDKDATYEINSGASVDITSQDEGNFLVSLLTNSGNLQNPNVLTPVSISVMNTYTYARNFSVRSSNGNFSVVDSSGNAINSFNIAANSDVQYTFYLKVNDDAVFLTENANTNIMVYSTNVETINAGSIDVLVDITELPDTEPPILGGPQISISNTEGNIVADWQLKDNGGTSIKEYTIILYSGTGEVERHNTNLNTYTFTNLAEGSYYYIVYGLDEAGNSGESSVGGASKNDGYAIKSDTLNARWNFNVTFNLDNLNRNGATSAKRGQTYTATLSASGVYRLPDTITVNMDGRDLVVNREYTYNNGNITIPNVSGDIRITATAGCLVEGTKIMLADGSTKNIEDIRYNDLLKVYNYETHEFTEEYPVWIEKRGHTNSYLLSTFSDGSTLKTVGHHGIFSVDNKSFVNVEDRDNYHVGTKVLKYENGKLKKVSVEKLEVINEEVNYYLVVTSVYYNVISDNIITSDGNVGLVNMYMFDENMNWQLDRSSIKQKDNNLFKYEELSDIVPLYMFKGLRVDEMKYLFASRILSYDDIDVIKKALEEVNDEILLPVPTINNKRYWMVSNSDGVSKKIKEGTYYKLPKPKLSDGFKGWYNTADNNIYQAGDKVKIEFGTHFKALYN